MSRGMGVCHCEERERERERGARKVKDDGALQYPAIIPARVWAFPSLVVVHPFFLVVAVRAASWRPFKTSFGGLASEWR